MHKLSVLCARIDGGGLEIRGRLLETSFAVELGADDAVRADEAAVAALDADIRLPHRYEHRDVALLPAGCGGRIGAVRRQHADWQQIAVAGHHYRRDFAHERGRLLWYRWDQLQFAAHVLVHFDLEETGERIVDRFEVLAHDLLALLAVGFLDGLLDFLDGLFLGHHSGQGEEAGLHHGVDAVAHAAFTRDRVGVDDMERHAFLDEGLLDDARQMLIIINECQTWDENRISK